MSERTEQLDSIRLVVQFLEDNPEVPIPTEFRGPLNIWATNRTELASLARILGDTTKSWVGEWFCVVKSIGCVRLELNISRSQVCQRVVTGQQWVPEEAGHYRDVIEWVCNDGSILKGVTE